MNSEQEELIKNLRELTNYLESKEFVSTGAGFGSVEVVLYCKDGQEFLENVSKMGSFTREFTDWSAQVIKKFGTCRFILHSSREMVCQKIKIGVKVLPAEPERIIPAKPERIVDEYEYKCPESLLTKANGTD